MSFISNKNLASICGGLVCAVASYLYGCSNKLICIATTIGFIAPRIIFNSLPEKMLKSDYELLREYYPYMTELMKVKGSTQEYYRKISERISKLNTKNEARISTVLNAIRHLSSNVFTTEDTELLISTLRTVPLASTAEHHCFLTFNEQLNTAINQACIRSFIGQDACIVFACSTLTLDGYTLPGVISFKDELIHVLSNKHRKKMVLQAPPFNSDNIETKLSKKHRFREEEGLESIRDWVASLSKIINKNHMFWEQISQFNYRFWATIFNKNISFHMPCRYFMLPLEEIVRLALIEELQVSRKGWLIQIILDPYLRQRLYKTLDGVETCWDTRLRKGSFLFWCISEGRRLQLNLEGENLCSSSEEKQSSFSVQDQNSLSITKKSAWRIDEDSLVGALRNMEIIPTAGFSIIYLSLYCGFDLLGGLFQVNYLPKIQAELIRDFKEVIDQEELVTIKNINTNFFVNFNHTQPAVLGGLYKIYSKISEKEILSLYKENFSSSLKRNIDRLIAISKDKNERCSASLDRTT